MGVSDDAADIIECDAAHLFPVFRYGEEPAVNGDMKAIRGKINHTLHAKNLTQLQHRAGKA